MAKGADTRRRILDSARDLFHARSYHDVGVQQICLQAGVQKGSFYYFFASKQGLALEVLDGMWLEEERQVLAVAYAAGLAPLARIARHAELRHDVSAAERAPRTPPSDRGGLAPEPAADAN